MTEEGESNRETGDRFTSFPRAVRWRGVLRDVLFVAVWVTVISFGWGYMRWPTSAYYVVVFGGIVAYSLTFDP